MGKGFRWDMRANVGQIVMPEVVVVEKLEESVRGAGGFGSTGGFGAAAA